MGYDTRKFHSNVTGSAVMRPIELTRTINGKRVATHVNPDLIACITDAHDRFETSISFDSGWTITVAETPKQILGRLADHRSAMHAEEDRGILGQVDWGPA